MPFRDIELKEVATVYYILKRSDLMSTKGSAKPLGPPLQKVVQNHMDHPANILLFEATYQEWGLDEFYAKMIIMHFKREIQAGNVEI